MNKAKGAISIVNNKKMKVIYYVIIINIFFVLAVVFHFLLSKNYILNNSNISNENKSLIAAYLNNVKQNKIPSRHYREKDEIKTAYIRKIECSDGLKGIWSIISWNLNISGTFKTGGSCDIYFDDDSALGDNHDYIVDYYFNKETKQYEKKINQDDKKKNTLTIYKNGAEGESETIDINNVQTITLEIPIKEGYKFVDWIMIGEGKINGNVFTPGNGETTIVAKFEPITYTINYSLNSGTCSNCPKTYTIESNNFTLPTPTRDGYKFTGWTGSNGSTAQTSVTISKGTTENKTYTANWAEYCGSNKQVESYGSWGSCSVTYTDQTGTKYRDVNYVSSLDTSYSCGTVKNGDSSSCSGATDICGSTTSSTTCGNCSATYTDQTGTKSCTTTVKSAYNSSHICSTSTSSQSCTGTKSWNFYGSTQGTGVCSEDCHIECGFRGSSVWSCTSSSSVSPSRASLTSGDNCWCR